MIVHVASSGWSRPATSAYTHARDVTGAARSAGVDARPLSLPTRQGRRLGGLLQPALASRVTRYAVHGGVVHHTGPEGALRGADVVTVHDLSCLEQPGFLGVVNRDSLRMTLRSASVIVTTTEFTAAQLAERWPRLADRIEVVRVPFAPPPANGHARHDGVDVLWIGTASPRKGLPLLLSTLLRMEDVSAVVRWNRTPHSAAPNRVAEAMFARAGPRVSSTTASLPDAVLEDLYASSKCIVSTSTREGFHAPIMEAYLRGVRVVVPSIPPYTELYPVGAPGVHFYGTWCRRADLYLAIREALDSGPFAPARTIVDSVAYGTIGSRLRAVYESATVAPGEFFLPSETPARSGVAA